MRVLGFAIHTVGVFYKLVVDVQRVRLEEHNCRAICNGDVHQELGRFVAAHEDLNCGQFDLLEEFGVGHDLQILLFVKFAVR